MTTEAKTVPLSLSTLDQLSDGVVRPQGGKRSLSPGILHFGPGNFHRAHQQVYLEALMNEGRDHDWAVVGASVMPGDAALRDALLSQDLLNTVVEQSAETSLARVTHVMSDYLPVGDSAAILETLADPRIRIVALTVTEGGYFVNADTGEFDDTAAAIRQDASNIDAPKTVFGLIVRALKARRDESQAAFTVMSCDNLPHNGKVTRNAVVGLARLVDAGLAEWIEDNASFPNGMVDRIAPATGERERRLVREDFNIADNAPVFCEDFSQWVLEDKFVAGRPAFDAVGVEFVDDVVPYENMKLRILNGGHATIAYAAGLLDIEFVYEAMQNPLVRGFLEKVEHDQIIPIVPPVPGTDLEEYARRVATRFANPKIGDTVRRICFDGSNRQSKFLVPAIRDRLAQGLPVDGLALATALWCRYCYGETDSGRAIEPNDPVWSELVETSRKAREKPALWLAMRDVYGSTGEDERFVAAFSQALNALWSDGTEAVLRRYTGG